MLVFKLSILNSDVRGGLSLAVYLEKITLCSIVDAYNLIIRST